MAQEIDFSSNVSLKPEDKDRFQFVYDTQLYMTFFGVYGRFTCAPDDDGIEIKQIDFIGINYKGLLNLKIDEVELDEDDGVDLSKKRDLDIKLYLRVTFEPRPKTDIYEFQPDKKVVVEPGKVLTINRELRPMYSGSSNNIVERAIVNGHFDSEFYVRDGMFIRERLENGNNTIFTTADFVGDKVPHDKNPFNQKFNMLSPGWRCQPGTSKFQM